MFGQVKGFIPEGTSDTKKVVELIWLKKGHFNGKFFKNNPTFKTARINHDRMYL